MAYARNQVVCAEPGDCRRPGTWEVVLGFKARVLREPISREPIVLEFCEEHARRRMGTYEVPLPV